LREPCRTTSRRPRLSLAFGALRLDDGDFSTTGRSVSHHFASPALSTLSCSLITFGVIEEYGGPCAEAQRYNIPVLPRPLFVIAKDIAIEIEQIAKKRQPLRPRWRRSARSITSFRMGQFRRRVDTALALVVVRPRCSSGRSTEQFAAIHTPASGCGGPKSRSTDSRTASLRRRSHKTLARLARKPSDSFIRHSNARPRIAVTAEPAGSGRSP
jgi:hypothetical protein